MNSSIANRSPDKIQPKISKSERNDIKIPLTLILSEPGVAVFTQKKRKLQKFTLANNKVGYGTSLTSYSAEFLQKMMFNGYIWKMEFSARTGAMPDRRDLIDLTKISTHALLSRQFYNTVQHEIYNSDLIRQWNRNNPKRTIDPKTRFNPEFLNSFADSNAQIVRQITEEIQSSVYEYIKFQPSMRESDQDQLIGIAEKYVSFLGGATIFLLSIQKGSIASKKLMLRIREILKLYLDKSIVAEYLSLLLVELLVYLRPEVFRETGFSDPGRITIGFNYSQRGWNRHGDRVRKSICIYDSIMLKKNNVHQEISDRVNKSMQEVSLKEFYEKADSNIAIAGLGLFYLSYLKDVCNKMDILFDSLVSQVSGEETEVNLSMRF